MAGSGFDLGGLLGGMQGIQDSWLGFSETRKTRIAASPCSAQTETLEWLTVKIDPQNRDWSETLARVKSERTRIRKLAVDKMGRSSSSYSGVKRFATYLLENNIVPANEGPGILAIFLGPFGALIGAGITVEVVDDALTIGRPSKTNSGTRLAAGVYLHNGRLRGSVVRKAYDQWATDTRGSVHPPGQSSHWQASVDGFEAKVAYGLKIRAEIKAMADEAGRQCLGQRYADINLKNKIAGTPGATLTGLGGTVTGGGGRALWLWLAAGAAGVYYLAKRRR